MSYQSTCQKKPYDDDLMRPNSPKFTNRIGCCLGYILTLTDEQLYQLDINPSGEITTAQPLIMLRQYAATYKRCFCQKGLPAMSWIAQFGLSPLFIRKFICRIFKARKLCCLTRQKNC